MKCIVLLLAVASAICAVSAVPLPQHGMFFYQQQQQQAAPSMYYRQPVHRMYVQYQQPYRAAAQRRSAAVPTSGVSAYVAGNQVAASGSTFLKGLISRLLAKKRSLLTPLRKNYFAQAVSVHLAQNTPTTTAAPSPPLPSPSHADDDQQAAAEPEILADELPVQDDDGAVSIAEAYPAADDHEEEAADEPQHDAQPELLDAPVPAEAAAADVPAAPAAVAPKKKNKVTIELDTAADDEEQEEVLLEEELIPVYRKKAGRRPAYGGAAAAPAAPSNPINTFFPISFGNTQGGAIAVANAYSTGQKGGARSHAIAYGSPASAAKKQKRRQAEATNAAVAQ